MDEYIQNIGANARNASHKLSYVTTNQKNDFLEDLAKKGNRTAVRAPGTIHSLVIISCGVV